jgi:hypothetical protein
MKKQHIVSVFVPIVLFLMSPMLAHASGTYTWTDQSGAGSRTWTGIASSFDGTHLVATEGLGSGHIYTSTNSGASWTVRNGAGLHSWISVASSYDGTRLAAASQSGDDIFTSADSGATWTDRVSAGARSWKAITSSSDGTHLAAIVFNGDIFTSADSGATWTDRSSAGTRGWRSIASSIDGTHLVAVASGDDIYTSADSGATWTDRTSAGNRFWYAAASSADGTHLVAAEYGGSIYTSADSGATWTAQAGAGTDNWSSIASSANGSRLIAVGATVHSSINGGSTWAVETGAGTRSWAAVTSSSDALKIAAVNNANGSGGDIYTGAYAGAADVTAPSATVTTPAAAATVSGTSVVLSATATDDTAVGGVTFYINGAKIGSEVTSGSATFTTTWDSTATSTGAKSIVAVARDTSNNFATSSPVSFTLATDSTVPIVAVSLPTPGATAAGSAVTLIASSTDNVGVAGVTFYIDGTKINSEVTSSNTTFTTVWNSLATSTGSHSIIAVSRDTSNNFATSSPVAFTTATDSTPPSIVLTSPASAAVLSGASVPLSATANDNFSVAGVTFYIDGIRLGSEVTSSNSTFATTWDTTTVGVSAGAHTITATARDTSNNYATTSVAISVNNGPVISSVVVTPSTTSAIISWSTNLLSTGTVSYGLTSSYGSASTTIAGFTVSNSVTLTNLTPGTTYHYLIGSVGVTAQTGATLDQTFVTTALAGGGGGGSGGGVSGGGGGGGGGSSTATAIATASDQTCLYYIATGKRICSGTAGTPSTATGTVLGASDSSGLTLGTTDSVIPTLTKTLVYRSRNLQVKNLQRYLNTHGFVIATTGNGSYGSETTYFGLATEFALKKFQVAHGIKPATGFLGPKTRAYINAHP